MLQRELRPSSSEYILIIFTFNFLQKGYCLHRTSYDLWYIGQSGPALPKLRPAGHIRSGKVLYAARADIYYTKILNVNI
jgi:hypothetical protein